MAKALEATGESNADQTCAAAEEQISCKPLGKNPLSDRQNNTDLSFSYILCGLFITFCIGLTIYNSPVKTFTTHYVNSEFSYSMNKQSTDEYEVKYTIDELSNVFGKHYVKRAAVTCIVTTFMIVLGFLRLLLSDEEKGFFVHMARIILMIGAFGLSAIIISFGDLYYFTVTFICSSLMITYALSINISINKVGVTTIARFITKSCQAIHFFRYLTIFAVFIMILTTFVLMVTLTVYQRNRIDFLHFMTTVGGIYISLFIIYFGKMTVAQTIATWHWAQDKEAISARVTLKCIGIICRFHLGTIALAATVIWPLYFALKVVFKLHSSTSKQSFTNRFISTVCKIYLTVFVSGYALIITSIHGQSFFQATKKMFNLMTKNYSLLLGVANVITIIMFIATLIIIPLSMLATGFICYVFSEIDINENIMKVFLASIIYLLIPIGIMVLTAVDATLVCSLDDSEENDKNEFQSWSNRSCSRPTAPAIEV